MFLHNHKIPFLPFPPGKTKNKNYSSPDNTPTCSAVQNAGNGWADKPPLFRTPPLIPGTVPQPHTDPQNGRHPDHTRLKSPFPALPPTDTDDGQWQLLKAALPGKSGYSRFHGQVENIGVSFPGHHIHDGTQTPISAHDKGIGSCKFSVIRQHQPIVKTNRQALIHRNL